MRRGGKTGLDSEYLTTSTQLYLYMGWLDVRAHMR